MRDGYKRVAEAFAKEYFTMWSCTGQSSIIIYSVFLFEAKSKSREILSAKPKQMNWGQSQQANIIAQFIVCFGYRKMPIRASSQIDSALFATNTDITW